MNFIQSIIKSGSIVFVLLVVAFHVHGQSGVNLIAPKFEGDIPMLIIRQLDNNLYVFTKTSDSTELVKVYGAEDLRLFHVYGLDSKGYMHGNLYHQDALKKTVTTGIMKHGEIVEAITVNENNDTIYYEKMLTDSLSVCHDIKDGQKKKWFLNKTSIYNGPYTITDQESAIIRTRGQYKAIKFTDIINMELYSALTIKYGRTNMFRGMAEETEIPIGTWYYYDKNGALIKTEEYDWQGCINGVE